VEIKFRVIRNRKTEEENRMEVGGSTVFHLCEAIIKAGNDSKWTMLNVRVFGSEEEGNEWKNEVRERFNSEGSDELIGSMGDSLG